MRSSVLGWVLNIRAMPALLDRASASGLWMYIDACAGCTAIGRCSAMASMRRSALASGCAGAEQLGGAAVGLELAGSRHRHLDQRRGDRREDRGGEHDQRVGVATVAVAAAEHRRVDRHLRHERDRRGDRGGDRADQDVAVLDVHQLVRHHALDLVGRERLQQAPGWRRRRRASGRGRWRTRWVARRVRWRRSASASRPVLRDGGSWRRTRAPAPR